MEQGKFEEAEKLMLEDTEKDVTGFETVDRAWFYENWGDSTGRREIYERSLDFYEAFASWATSGGEGTARMIDVKRVQKKIAELR